jgi:hypothetical protein
MNSVEEWAPKCKSWPSARPPDGTQQREADYSAILRNDPDKEISNHVQKQIPENLRTTVL